MQSDALPTQRHQAEAARRARSADTLPRLRGQGGWIWCPKGTRPDRVGDVSVASIFIRSCVPESTADIRSLQPGSRNRLRCHPVTNADATWQPLVEYRRA